MSDNKTNLKHLNGASTAGNVDKTWTVSGYRSLRPLYGQVVLITDATVTGRRVILQVLDSDDNVVFDTHSGAVVPASQSGAHHEFMQGVFRETTFVSVALQVPIPVNLEIPNGYKLNITIQAGQPGDSYTSNFMCEYIP